MLSSTAAPQLQHESASAADTIRGLRGREASTLIGALLGQRGVALALTGLDGRITHAGEKFAELLRRSGDDLVGVHVGELGHPDDADAYRRQALALARGEVDSYTVEQRWLRPEGACFWGRATVTAARSAEPGGSMAVCIIEDVDASRRMQREHVARRLARQSHKRLRALFDYAPVPALLWQARGDELVLRELNRAAMQLTESKGAELLGRTARALYHDEPTLLRALYDCLGGQVTPSWETDYRMRSTGQVKPLRITCAAIGRGMVIEYLEDMSDRLAAEQRSRRYMDELLHVKRIAGQAKLLASLVHEVAQPITAVTNYIHAARCGVELGHDRALVGEALDAAADESRRMQQVFTRVRGLLKHRESHAVPTDLRVLAEGVMRRLRAGAPGGAELILDAPEDLPRVVADPLQIEQALTNLVRNAVEAVADEPAGRRGVIVQLHPLDNGRLQVAVIDRGPGLDADQAQRVFEPFFSTKPQGLGMGLSVCQTIVESHGGRLRLETPAGGGCAFRFDLPTCCALREAHDEPIPDQEAA